MSEKNGNAFSRFFFRLLPRDRWYLPFVAFIWNQVVFYGARLINLRRAHFNMETALDRMIPLVPWTIAIYFGCFLYWAANFILITRSTKYGTYRFFIADVAGLAVCLIVFLLYPTTNVRPEVTGRSFWDYAMRFLYRVDIPDNLFPSIHCLVSWLCFAGVRSDRSIPLPHRIFSFVFTLMVFGCTLTTHQHVIADVLSGLVLAELSWQFAGLVLRRIQRRRASESA